MLVLQLFFLLLTVGTFLAYRFSSASKVKKRMQGALLPFEELDAELRRMRQSLQNDIELSSSQYIQGVNAARLKAIPLDELKKHATGMRLQALAEADSFTAVSRDICVNLLLHGKWVGSAQSQDEA
jgi:hypothetical protein